MHGDFWWKGGEESVRIGGTAGEDYGYFPFRSMVQQSGQFVIYLIGKLDKFPCGPFILRFVNDLKPFGGGLYSSRV